MTSNVPTCPGCNQAMKFGGFVLCRREDDGQRVCRGVEVPDSACLVALG